MQTSNMGIAALQFQNTRFDVVDRSNRPWLRVSQIGRALGYAQPDAHMTRLYHKHADEFTDSMTAVIKMPTAGGVQDTRIFSLRGAHLLAMLSRTEVAKDFRRWVLDILERESAVPPAPTFDPVAFDQAGKALIGMVQTLLPQHSLRQSYQIANAHIKAATGQDVLSVWPIVLAELDDTRPALHVATAGANLSSLPPLPWANKSKKPAVKSRHDKQLERLASYLRHPERIAVYSTTYAVSRDLIADLLAKGYIPRQVLLKRMHVPAAEFNLLIAEGKEAGIVLELDGVEFNYAGTVYVAGGAA